MATLLLMSLIFAPVGIWPIAFVCLVPWLILVGGSSRAPRVYLYSFMLGLAFFLINMRWLYAATGWGYLALSVYQACYIPLVACPVRHVVRRRGWPLALAFPLVWTGCEMLRAVVISGFPWFYLSHSLSGVLTLIQISDLVGAYGVSFVVAAVNGAIADVIIAVVSSRRAHHADGRLATARVSVALAGVLLAGVAIYGRIQLGSDTIAEGPKVALIQGDFLNTVNVEEAKDHDRFSDEEKLLVYSSMLEAAAAEQPDMYVLPETPWIMFLNRERRDFDALSQMSFATLRDHAVRNNGVVVTGSATYIPTPTDLLAKDRRYNSATVFTPDGAEPQRYDKVHLVYFGETVPFRFGRLRFLYFWLNWIMPFSGPDHNIEYSLFKGSEFRPFTMKTASDGRTYRFAVPICYEDVMPYVSREFTSGDSDTKRVDFLLNISNDGWFGRGIQQAQHLAICVFRAVENRVGIARAVNTGISAFIQPSGLVHDVVTSDASTPWPGKCGYAVANVGVDSRFTVYSRYGDWFAWSCALMWLLLFIDYWVVRARGRSED